MNLLDRYIFNILFILLSFVFSGDADHLIFNRISIKPNQAEMIEIYNPTNSDIDLSNYYLSDQNEYFNWPVQDVSSSRDFLIKFPIGSIIYANGTFVITTQSIEDFYNYYEYNPDISLIDTEFEESDIGASANLLSDSKEMLILFYNSGDSNIYQDVDYFLWGGYDLGVEKNITDHGYPFNDTPLADQIFIRNYTVADFYDSLYVRIDINEYDENQNEGNGITGHDETSENLVSSWMIAGYERTISFQDILNGDYDCSDDLTFDACEPGELPCSFVEATGLIEGYYKSESGPHAITLEDEAGYQLSAISWTSDWDISNDDLSSYLLEPPYKRFLVKASGYVFDYNGNKQIQLCGPENLEVIASYDMEGYFDGSETFNTAVINPAPYILIPSASEVLDYSYSFPSNSRVIIRVFDISGRFITTLVDKYYPSSGTVKREEFYSAWDGTNHIGQVLSPGTYLMHMEASNFQTGSTSIDVAPVVIGVK